MKPEDIQKTIAILGDTFSSSVAAISLGIGLVLFSLVIIFGVIPEIINRLINPEWQTINDLVNLVKPKSK